MTCERFFNNVIPFILITATSVLVHEEDFGAVRTSDPHLLLRIIARFLRKKDVNCFRNRNVYSSHPRTRFLLIHELEPEVSVHFQWLFNFPFHYRLDKLHCQFQFQRFFSFARSFTKIAATLFTLL